MKNYNNFLLEKALIEKFIKLCELLFVSYDHNLYFPFDEIEYALDYSYIDNDKDYQNVLKKKMENMLNLINKERHLIDADIETVIWNRI